MALLEETPVDSLLIELAADVPEDVSSKICRKISEQAAEDFNRVEAQFPPLISSCQRNTWQQARIYIPKKKVASEVAR